MKKTTKIIIALALTLILAVGVFFGIKKISKNNSKLLVTTTNFPAYDFVRAAAGDMANVKMLVKPGVETHDFEPTPEDIMNIKNSDLFVYTGGESDEWVERILNEVDTKKTKIVKMMDAVEIVPEEEKEGMEEHEHEHEHEEVEYDEHVWTSPKNAVLIVRKISETLFDEVSDGANKYIEELNDLDKKFRDVVNDGSRKVVVFGDRFPLRYFVDEYRLDYFAAFPGCSDQTEASASTIGFLVDKIRSEKIPVVFKIELSNGKLADTVSRETGVKVLTFNSLHNVTKDDFESGKTYVDLMSNNIEALKEALK